jgi:hypothetical protein
MSTSFDTSTLNCITCTGVNKVLRREIEGEDVGLDYPPVFILTDQNFPSTIPAGGEGECMKIIQVEHGSLAELVGVFLEITKGFAIPAGTILLLASASHMAAVGTAEYAADFVCANIRIREALTSGVRILHGIPFLIGGTSNIPAIRSMAKINHWLTSISGVKHDIAATRALWASQIRNSNTCNDCTHTIRLPVSLHKLELGTFTSGGFSNLTAVALLSEENDHELVLSLIGDLNDLFTTELCMEPIVDRFLDEEVFEAKSENKKQLLLVGSSHLHLITEHPDTGKWEIFDLSSGGFRISDHSVAELTTKVDTLRSNETLKDCTAIVQLYDNSVYLVGGPGGTRHLPVADTYGRYHVDGPLLLADKAGIRDLTSQLTPLVKALAGIRKIFLTPLAKYWLKPCCEEDSHHVNFKASGYLSALGSNIFHPRGLYSGCAVHQENKQLQGPLP